MRFEIVPMREDDLTEVVAIEELTGLNRWGFEAYRREMYSNPNAVMYVARAGDHLAGPRNEAGEPYRILGFVASALLFDELHINNIATRPEVRRLGIGRALMDTAMEDGRLRGASFSVLEVRASNVTAQAMYQAMGFRASRRRKDYYRTPAEDALEMIRDL